MTPSASTIPKPTDAPVIPAKAGTHGPNPQHKSVTPRTRDTHPRHSGAEPALVQTGAGTQRTPSASTVPKQTDAPRHSREGGNPRPKPTMQVGSPKRQPSHTRHPGAERALVQTGAGIQRTPSASTIPKQTDTPVIPAKAGTHGPNPQHKSVTPKTRDTHPVIPAQSLPSCRRGPESREHHQSAPSLNKPTLPVIPAKAGTHGPHQLP